MLDQGVQGVGQDQGIAGFIETEMTKKLDEEVRERNRQFIPLGAFGTPLDVANAVLFLSSELSKYITGQVITVDGGMVM